MQSCPAHRPCAKVNGAALKLRLPRPTAFTASPDSPDAAPSEHARTGLDFTTLYDAYAPLVRWGLRNVLSRTLYNSEAEDLTQEVFLRLVKHAPTLPTHTDRVRWLMTVTRHVAISARRKRRMTTNCELVDQLLTATK